MASTRIIFVRHCESEGNPTNRFYDSPGVKLTSAGATQAVITGTNLCRYITDNEVSVVYCSPWQRAKETCKIALAESRIDYQAIQYDERLKIETLPELEYRVRGFLNDIARWHPNETIIVFSHGGVGRMMQGICEGWPEEGRFWEIPFIENGGIKEWFYGN